MEMNGSISRKSRSSRPLRPCQKACPSARPRSQQEKGRERGKDFFLNFEFLCFFLQRSAPAYQEPLAAVGHITISVDAYAYYSRFVTSITLSIIEDTEAVRGAESSSENYVGRSNNEETKTGAVRSWGSVCIHLAKHTREDSDDRSSAVACVATMMMMMIIVVIRAAPRRASRPSAAGR